MDVTITFDEVDYGIFCGWLESGAEGKAATKKALDYYGERVGVYILYVYPVFDPVELADIVQETFLDLFRQGEANTLPQNMPLLQLLFQAALCNAKDAIGKRTRFSEMKDDLGQDVKALIAGTNTENLWNSINAKNRFQDLRIDFLKFVKDELKGQQKVIAGVFGSRIPDALDFDDMQKEIHDQYGELITKSKIIATWDKVRQKFKEYMKKHSITRQ
jgi:DNA-directed RNA polymerase specialized sigma24 family protein